MNFDHLKLFRDVAQERSISKGAVMNAVSQSAASQHLQELERVLEVKLVDRSRRPLALTEAGQLYYDFCREVLRTKNQFDVSLEQFKGRVEGTVKVASIYSVGLVEMSRLEAEFAARFPGAELWVDYLRPEKVYEAITSEKADLGLVSYPEPSKEIQVIPWREEKMGVAVAPGHRLAQHEVLHAKDLEGENFVGFDEDLPISRDVRRYLREFGVYVDVVMRFDNIQMMKEAVALGSGISILPERILKADIEQGRVKAIAIEDPSLSRPLGILHLKKKRFSRATQSFLNLLTEELVEA